MARSKGLKPRRPQTSSGVEVHRARRRKAWVACRLGGVFCIPLNRTSPNVIRDGDGCCESVLLRYFQCPFERMANPREVAAKLQFLSWVPLCQVEVQTERALIEVDSALAMPSPCTGSRPRQPGCALLTRLSQQPERVLVFRPLQLKIDRHCNGHRAPCGAR